MKEATGDKQLFEDILSDEALSERIMNGNFNENFTEESELHLSGDFLHVINADKGTFNSEDKILLASRITESIENSKRRRFFVWMGYAASLIIIAGFSFYFFVSEKADIVTYAAHIKVEENAELTQLMLQGNNVVRIESDESKIAYSKSGSSVVINASNQISQPVENDQIAFNTIFVPYGKRSQVILPDSSSIWLNSGSKLVYPVHFDSDKREVYLEGEALFEVAHNANCPFHVLTKGVDVKVLGTVFDLSAYNEDSVINTVLEKGSVEINYNKTLIGGSKLALTPGELGSYSLKQKFVTKSEVDTKDFTSWKDGYLSLEKKSLESITRRLSRYYNVTIEFEDPVLAKETFSGYLDLRSSADQVLGMIAEIVDIQIIQTDKVIKIRRKGPSI